MEGDTDYQHIFSVFDEISDRLEDQGCLCRPWRAQQLKDVPTPQPTVQKGVNRRRSTKDVIDGIQQRGRGLSCRESRANRQDPLRRLDGYA